MEKGRQELFENMSSAKTASETAHCETNFQFASIEFAAKGQNYDDAISKFELNKTAPPFVFAISKKKQYISEVVEHIRNSTPQMLMQSILGQHCRNVTAWKSKYTTG